MADPNQKVNITRSNNLEKGKANLALAGINTGPEEVLFGNSVPSLAQIEKMAKRQKAIEEKSKKQNEARERKEAALEFARKEIRRAAEEKRYIGYFNPYFAGVQCAIFIGDRWVDDVITIEYTESVSKAPLYGYSSQHFDAIAKGNIIVQGQFAIAYTGPNYLPSILERYGSTVGSSDILSGDIGDPIERAKKLFWKLESPNDPASTIPLQYGYVRGVTGEVRRGFDIRVFFGGQEFIRDTITTPRTPSDTTPRSPEEVMFGIDSVSASGPIEVIQNVHLTSRSVIVAPSGEPIAESYSFLASGVTTKGRTAGQRITAVPTSRSGNIPVATLGGAEGLRVNQHFTPKQ